jgi:hypothetical protein
MKRSSRPTRTPASLSESVRQHLDMYALAASAAGVGVLALIQPAHAKIVYTAAHVRILADNLPFYLDLNHDGVNDFSFLNYNGVTDDMVSLGIIPVNASNEIWSHTGYAAALREGVSIGPKGKFQRRYDELMAVVNFSHSTCQGPWGNVKRRFLGLKFIIKGKTHFGWARLNATCNAHNPQINAVLTGYAYETIPNKPIIAGKTKGPQDISAEEPHAALTMPATGPCTLGLLAQGSPGPSIWRRKEWAGSPQ